jgi:hypothetical protein
LFSSSDMFAWTLVESLRKRCAALRCRAMVAVSRKPSADGRDFLARSFFRVWRLARNNNYTSLKKNIQEL